MNSTARHVRWPDGGMRLGFEHFPDYVTQGESLRKSKRILATGTGILRDGEIPVPLGIAGLAVE
jgi:hypothetical protein